jgi:putative tryptophan/tyrosine transport system substrate-binding protein
MRVTRLAVVLSLGLVFCPHIAEAQAAKIPRVGYLVLAPLSDVPSPERAAFLAGLRELGWIEGKTIAIEYRSANWNTELMCGAAPARAGVSTTSPRNLLG